MDLPKMVTSGSMTDVKNGRADVENFTTTKDNVTVGDSIVKGDNNDTANLGGFWSRVDTGVTDKLSGVKGDLYKNNEGRLVLVEEGVKVEIKP